MHARLLKAISLRLLQLALLATLVLRVLVPVGYMPAALSAGWPVQLCPDGLSSAAMTALLGEQHQHHGMHAMPVGAHHGDHGVTEQPQPSVDATPGQCDLAAFSGAVAPATSAVTLLPPRIHATVVTAVATLHVRSVAYERYRSRAPPV